MPFGSPKKFGVVLYGRVDLNGDRGRLKYTLCHDEKIKVHSQKNIIGLSRASLWVYRWQQVRA
jgi:hypothetical protein